MINLSTEYFVILPPILPFLAARYSLTSYYFSGWNLLASSTRLLHISVYTTNTRLSRKHVLNFVLTALKHLTIFFTLVTKLQKIMIHLLMPMLVTIEDTQQPVEEQQSQNNENARTEHEQQWSHTVQGFFKTTLLSRS